MWLEHARSDETDRTLRDVDAEQPRPPPIPLSFVCVCHLVPSDFIDLSFPFLNCCAFHFPSGLGIWVFGDLAPPAEGTPRGQNGGNGKRNMGGGIQGPKERDIFFQLSLFLLKRAKNNWRWKDGSLQGSQVPLWFAAHFWAGSKMPLGRVAYLVCFNFRFVSFPSFSWTAEQME